MVFAESTVRPWPSVSRPLVEHLQQHVEHVRWAWIFDFVESTTTRAAAHRLGQLTALVVADVAGRAADKPCHRNAFRRTRSRRYGPWRVRRRGKSASAWPARSCATPVGPRNRNEPVGRLGSATPARVRRTASETACTALRCPITRLPSSPPCAAAWRSHLQQPAGRDAGPRRHHVGDIVRPSSLSMTVCGLRPAAARIEFLLDLRDAAVPQFGGLGQIAVALGLVGLPRNVLELFLEFADDVDGVLPRSASGWSARPASPSVGKFGAQLLQPFLGGGVPSFSRAISRSPGGAPGARPIDLGRAGSRSPCAAGRRPHRPGRWPGPAGTGW